MEQLTAPTQEEVDALKAKWHELRETTVPAMNHRDATAAKVTDAKTASVDDLAEVGLAYVLYLEAEKADDAVWKQWQRAKAIREAASK